MGLGHVVWTAGFWITMQLFCLVFMIIQIKGSMKVQLVHTARYVMYCFSVVTVLASSTVYVFGSLLFLDFDIPIWRTVFTATMSLSLEVILIYYAVKILKMVSTTTVAREVRTGTSQGFRLDFIEGGNSRR